MRFLVVEDHKMVAEMFAVFLRDQLAATVDIVSTLAEAGGALAAASEPFDLVLLDLDLPDASGLEGLHALRRDFPAAPLFVLTGHEDPATAAAALTAGAAGYEKKSVEPAVLKHAIEIVLAGGAYLPSHLMYLLKPGPAPEPSPDRSPPKGSTLAQLTPRQRDVAEQIAKGLQTKEIARRLGVAPPTVKSHTMVIFGVLGVNNVAAAAVILARLFREEDGGDV